MNYTRAQEAFLLMCALYLVPSCTFAQVLISEIHYNPVGTDDKHEYIEVCNSAQATIDVAQYKLFESSSNHGLTLSRGTGMLSSGACAVFVTDPATFLTDFPSFSGNLFDVSFSLSNTGEALILRDAGGADVDGVSYSPSQGGNGDGQSLHRSGTSFSGGAVSPGTESGVVGQSGSGTSGTSGTSSASGSGTSGTTSGTTAASGSSSTTVFHTVTIEPPAQLFLRVPSEIRTATHAVVAFTAESYNAKGGSEDPQYSWVFGDGMRDVTPAGNTRSVTHAYRRAGEYEVVVTATKAGLFAEERIRVIVEDAGLSLGLIEDEKTLVIENTSAHAFDMTGVRITNTVQTYVLPEKTRIVGKQKLYLPIAEMGLTDMRRPRVFSLVSARGVTLAVVEGIAPLLPVTYGTSQVVSMQHEPMTILAHGESVDTKIRPQTLVASGVSQPKTSPTAEAIQTGASARVESEEKKPVLQKKVLPHKKVATEQAAAQTVEKKEVEGTTIPEQILPSVAESRALSAAAEQANPSIPQWVLVLIGGSLILSSVYASYVLGKREGK